MQKNTDLVLQELNANFEEVRSSFDELSEILDYVFADRAYKSLPQLLEKDFNIHVSEIKRDFIEYETLLF